MTLCDGILILCKPWYTQHFCDHFCNIFGRLLLPFDKITLKTQPDTSFVFLESFFKLKWNWWEFSRGRWPYGPMDFGALIMFIILRRNPSTKLYFLMLFHSQFMSSKYCQKFDIIWLYLFNKGLKWGYYFDSTCCCRYHAFCS